MTTQAVKKPQHLVALESANRVRLDRAILKGEIASGKKSVAEVLREVPRCVETMTVFDLLTAQRRWGDTRGRRFLQCIPISEGKTIGTLTDRQRRAIIELFGH